MKNACLFPLVIFFLLQFIFLPVSAQKKKSQKEEIKYTALSKEIIAMRGPDQKLRIKWMKLKQEGKTETKKYKKVLHDLKETDRNNTARMKEIVEQIGWPTYDAVGKRAGNTAWLIVQHADRDPLFQAKCLSLMKKAVDANQASSRDYAYLYDRVQLSKGEKQKYATQSTTNSATKQSFFQPIEDEENVQKNRDAMGVTLPVVDYAQRLNFVYTVPTAEEATKRAEAFTMSYRTNVDMARAAMKKQDYESAVKHYTQAIYSDGSTETRDYIQLARAISLAKHKDANWAFYHLMKAAVRGWDKIDEYETDPDFDFIKKANPGNWEDLMRTVNELL